MEFRRLHISEENAKYAARLFEMLSQGYSLGEAARELGISNARAKRIQGRTNARVSASDVAHWRTVQLLNLERLKRACEAVLEGAHVVVSNGQIVHQYVTDDEGKPIWDPVYGPDGEAITGDDGQVRVQQRKVPLADHGAVLAAATELRKIESEIMKLLGTATPVKQQVEIQQVDYVIKGVDLSKTLGLNLTQGNG